MERFKRGIPERMLRRIAESRNIGELKAIRDDMTDCLWTKAELKILNLHYYRRLAEHERIARCL